MSTGVVKTASTKSGAVAFHEHSDSEHLVGIGNLRVLICQDDDMWFAQGLEIDYAAEGDSFEDVKKNFENGLRGTIDLHLKAYKSLDHLLKTAPPRAWAPLLKSGLKMRYTQVSFHEHFQKVGTMEFPFLGIDYYEREAA